MDAKMTAHLQMMEQLKGETTSLQEQVVLRETQDLLKASLIPVITAFQDEVSV